MSGPTILDGEDYEQFLEHDPPDIEPTCFVDPDLDEFLDADEPTFDWLVEGLLERGDRVIVTGQEGNGKSTLLRQIGVQLASGIHPFTGEDIEPLQVLLVDCENSARQARRALRPLRELAGDRYRGGNLRLRVLGNSLDVARVEVRADLTGRINAQGIDVLIIGPLYKLIDDDPTKEVPAKAVADALDHLRAIRGTAVIIEAHSPYSEGVKSKRPKRPYGASLWSRWPEFGLYLGDKGELDHWRGQRDQRDWPTKLIRSEPWPWAEDEAVTTEIVEWHGPTRCIEAIVSLLSSRPGEQFSLRQLGTELRAIGKPFSNNIIELGATQARNEKRIFEEQGPRKARLFSITPPAQESLT